MPFGLGFGELVLILGVLGLPLFILLVAGTAVFRTLQSARDRPDLDYQKLSEELGEARGRIEELEAKLARVDESADFTRQLLQKELQRR